MIEKLPKSVAYKDGKLYFLDQTKLPVETVIEEHTSIEQVWDSIKKLKVRGAPAIGIAGAYGLYLGSKTLSNTDDKITKITEMADYLDSSRPTAVNLKWALERMVKTAKEMQDQDIKNIQEALLKEAIAIHEEDKQLCRKIGENSVHLIKDGMGLLTHCNAGSLAVSELGTALSPMYLAHENKVKFRVYSDETRPLLQGSRLTAWELSQVGIDVTVITDNMAAQMMKEGNIDLVIVGTDRVAANGDVANKIGTLGVAILAKHFNIPFYVACPSSTIDLSTPNGDAIVIEEREADEIKNFGERQTAPDNAKFRNPAFDVTPHELVTGLITEKGLFSYPYAEKIQELYK